MNKGDRRGGLRNGFTIFETMIVLAVTGALFVAIAVTLNGRQNDAEFIHGVQDAQAQIQQVIDQVSDGLYPSANNFSCTSSGTQLEFQTGLNTQGTNSSCVFLGRVIQFGVTDPTGLEDYDTYTIAGLLGPTVGSISPFQNVYPTVAASSTSSAFSETTTTFEYGITTCWISDSGPLNSCASKNSLGAVGFLMEPNSLSTAKSYISGIPQVDLVPIPGTYLDPTSSSQAIGDINSGLGNTTYTTINPSNGVQVCLTSGTTNQSGLITIGGSGRQLVVKLDIENGTTCQ